jgi:hypothetical protein
MSKQLEGYIKMMKHPVKFRMFLFLKLPAAFFSGVRIKEISASNCKVRVPYKWFSQNPFRSTYFACLAMGAELSTGALAMAHLYKRTPKVSMLVTGMNASFRKKATGPTYFLCDDGKSLGDAIEQAVKTGNGITITATSTGRNEHGDIVAIFSFEWSFKVKA